MSLRPLAHPRSLHLFECAVRLPCLAYFFLKFNCQDRISMDTDKPMSSIVSRLVDYISGTNKIREGKRHREKEREREEERRSMAKSRLGR